MSDLRPKGIPVSLLDGIERDILFTLAVVDEVQAEYNEPVGKVMARLTDSMQTYQVLTKLLTMLINDSIRRSKSGDDPITEDDVKELIDVPLAAKLVGPVMKAFGYSLPEDEDEDPNAKRSRSS